MAGSEAGAASAGVSTTLGVSSGTSACKVLGDRRRPSRRRDGADRSGGEWFVWFRVVAKKRAWKQAHELEIQQYREGEQSRVA